MVFDTKKTCRACMAETNLLIPIWNVETESSDEERCSSITWKVEILNAFTKSGVSIDDQLPQHICVKCEIMLEQTYVMKRKCEKSESEFKRYQPSTTEYEEHLISYEENYDDYANDEPQPQMPYNYDDDDGEWTEIKMFDENGATEKSNENQQKPSTSHSYAVPKQRPSFVLSEQNRNDSDENENAATLNGNSFDVANMVEYESGNDNGNSEHQKENKRMKLSEGSNNKNKRQFTCTHCGKDFTRSDSLARHVKTHTGERPHVCQICGKGFIQSTHLKAHTKTHNRAEIGDALSDRNAN